MKIHSGIDEEPFFTPERWAAESKRHYTRLDLPAKASTFLAPLLARVRAGVAAVAKSAREGSLRVDDELHLTPMPAEDEDPKVIQLRAQSLRVFRLPTQAPCRPIFAAISSMHG